MNERKPNICLISFPHASKAPYIFISDMIKILDPLSDNLYLIDSNIDRIKCSKKINVIDINTSMHFIKEKNPRIFSIILYIIKLIMVQIKTSIALVKISNQIDMVIFYVAYPCFFLPLLCAKLLKIKSVEIVSHTKHNYKGFIGLYFWINDILLYRLLDYISPETYSIVKQLNLDKHPEKLLPIGSRFIDTDLFKSNKKILERDNVIGYIGRIDSSKGIINLLKSRNLISNKYNVKFVIIGNGDKDIINEIEKENNIKYYGWIEHDKLSQYMNEFKLLVLPTEYDCLPTVLLEALSCGTPVLTTKVGGIPDIIIPEKTGFFLDNNSTDCIANCIEKILDNKDLQIVSSNGEKMIKDNFSFNAALQRYKNIIDKVLYDV